MKANQKGFSIVEILIVIIVIGLLGAVGWLVYDRQSNKNRENTNTIQTEQPSSAQTAEPKSDSVADVLDALDKRLNDQSTKQTVSANAKYTLESVPSNSLAVEIKENGDYVQKKPAEGNSKSYRLNRVTTEFESYDEYISNFKGAANDLVDYAVSDLGFTKVDTHTVDGPADTYIYQLVKKSNMYCQVEHATDTFIDIGCVEQ
jgi:prepilin-type N-terminal cleavage/methylation domain-containing protein